MKWREYFNLAKDLLVGVDRDEKDQILRTIKKVLKGQIDPEDAKTEANRYFDGEGIEFLPEHINAINNVLEYLQSLPEFESARIDAQLAAELQVERKREERDIVFVIMQLAA